MTRASGALPSPFPDTRWSIVLSGDRGQALDHLAAAYWRPVYGYVRAHFARDEAEALDATQDFFVRLLDGDLLDRADPARGRFRAYVRKALANFLTDSFRERRSHRRGGDRLFVPIGAGDSEGAPELPDTRGRSPEEALDELWRAEILERAARDLERELIAEGKPVWWALFREAVLDGDRPSHAEMAERHGVTVVDVTNWLSRARSRYRAALIRIVRETVVGEASLEDEIDWLLGENAR